MRAATGVWRWRHNPLRRTTDLIEAWVALTAVVLLALAVPAAGWIAGAATDASLQRAVRAQHLQKLPTTARVIRLSDAPAPGLQSPESTGEQPARRAVVARWAAPDGTTRTGTVATRRELSDPGDTFTLWTDRGGRPVSPPMRPETAHAHAIVIGFLAATLAGLFVESVRRLVVRRLVHGRYRRLDRAWAKAGPDWGRTGAGS
ncbi:Rv1733c family protein [Streptomyces sp. NPDC054975]